MRHRGKQGTRVRRAQGFSLLEVLVAFAILAMILGIILQIFSGGLRNAALTEQYTRAISVAESKIEELGRMDTLTELAEEGYIENRHHWQARVQLAPWWEEDDDERIPVLPYQVTVQVDWNEGGKQRSVTLQTLRLAPSR